MQIYELPTNEVNLYCKGALLDLMTVHAIRGQ